MTSGKEDKRWGDQVFPVFPYWCRPRSNYSFSKNEVYDIERENLRLLRELCRLNPRSKPANATTSDILKLYHSGRNRHRKMQRIESENLAVLKRLHSTKATPSTRCSAQLEDYQRLASYPGTPSLFKYRPPKSMLGTPAKRRTKPPVRPCPYIEEDKEMEEAILRELQRKMIEEMPPISVSKPSKPEKPDSGPEEDDKSEKEEKVDETEENQTIVQKILNFVQPVFQPVIDLITGGTDVTATESSTSGTDANQSLDPTQGADEKQSEDKTKSISTSTRVRDEASVTEMYDNDSFLNEVHRINHEHMQMLGALPCAYSYHPGHNQPWTRQGMEKESLSVLRKSTPTLRRANPLEDYRQYSHSPRSTQYRGSQALGRYDSMMAAYAASPRHKL